MTQKIFIISLLFSMVLAMGSCLPAEEKWTEDGMAPLYVSPTDFTQVYTEGPKESIDQGATLEDNGYIYINERFKGIHVFDNSDPANVERVYFWRIPGNTEFQIDENYLYADNSRHLLTIDISDPSDIEVLSHIKDVYTVDLGNNNYPPDYLGRFECVNFDEGIVDGWEWKTLNSPRCYIF